MSTKSFHSRRTPALYVASFFCIAPLVALPPAAQARTRRHVKRAKKVKPATAAAPVAIKPVTTVIKRTAVPDAAATKDGLDVASTVPATPAATGEADENAPGAPAAAVAEDENAPGPPGPPAPAAAAEDENAPGPPGPPGPPAPGGAVGDDDGPENAQTYPGQAAFVGGDYWEAGVSSHHLTDGFGNWSSVYARTQYRLNDRNALLAEVEHSKEFGDSGTYFALGDTYTINNDWYASLTAGTSDSGFFLPRVRVDAFLNRKLLKDRNLVATIGAGYYKARDIHNDHSLYLGATYYFAPKWIIEGGVRFNRSAPGSVDSTSQFVALTYGQDYKRFITLRAGAGREAYQFIGPTTELVDFPSNEQSITIRQWLGRKKDRGVNLVYERYSSSSYRSRGGSIGYFQNY